MSSNLPIAVTKPTLERPEVLATFFRALADRTRARILELPAAHPMTVSELARSFGVAQGHVSALQSCLRWCGYVRAEVDGRRNRHARVDDRIREILATGESNVRDNADQLTSRPALATEERG